MNAESTDPGIDSLLDFWFEGHPSDPDRLAALKRKWFVATPEQDCELGDAFAPLADAAALGELDAWSETPRGRLALILLLDQLPRNLHRGTPAAFGQDEKALKLCLDGLEQSVDQALKPLERMFFCMPLQHAESREAQALAAETFSRLAAADVEESIAAVLQNAADSASQHRSIVDRFGRFPHRNKALGRQSTDEEREFLGSGGPSFGQ